VDALRDATEIFGFDAARGQGCHVCGLYCGSHAAGPDGSSRIRSKSEPRALSTCRKAGFPDPVSSTVAPSLSFDLPTPQQPHSRERLRRGWSLINSTSRHESPDDPSHLVSQGHPHQHRRLAGHGPRDPRTCRGSPLRAAHWTTALTPMISRRRKVRSPIFEVALSFCLPPVECCSGLKPIQAAMSLPCLNVSAGGQAPPGLPRSPDRHRE
jgi:hypothetical protein